LADVNILDLIPPPNPLPSTRFQPEAMFKFPLVAKYVPESKRVIDRSSEEGEIDEEQLFNPSTKYIVYERECLNTQYKYTYGVKDLKDYANGQSRWKWNILHKKKAYYVPLDKFDKTLIFESRFESGNLGIALRVSDSEYELVMQNDALTKGYTQCKSL